MTSDFKQIIINQIERTSESANQDLCNNYNARNRFISNLRVLSNLLIRHVPMEILEVYNNRFKEVVKASKTNYEPVDHHCAFFGFLVDICIEKGYIEDGVTGGGLEYD